MMGLWADGWFYISSAGLLVSGILFFFLLGQYRVASEAADLTDGEQGAEKEAPAAIRPVYIPDEEKAPAKVASHPLPEPAAAVPEPKPKSEFAGPERRRDPNTTGGISPAVVYLQNIKVELAELHKDLRSLAKRVDDELSSVSTRDEALIERLGELTRAVETLKAAAPDATPAPKKARKAEKIPEPQPEPEVVVQIAPPAPEPEPQAEPEPAPEIVVLPQPKTEPSHSPDETIRMELGALVVPSVAPAPAPREEAPAPAPTEQPPEEKPRRGPVWPV